jgi:O-antigen ligase
MREALPLPYQSRIRSNANALSQQVIETTRWRKALLWMVAGYLTLSAAFQQLRVPPFGSGVPIGEVALLVSFFLLNPLVVLPRMAKQAWLLPLIVWWIFSIPRALFDISVGGMWSLRDASQPIESLFIVVGFWATNSWSRLEYFSRWFNRLFLAIAYMSLLIPFMTLLKASGPAIQGAAENSLTSVFQLTSLPSLALVAAAWLLFMRKVGPFGTVGTAVWAAILVGFSAGFSQERTVYNQIVILVVLLLLMNRRVGTKWIANILLGLGLIALISALNLPINGRLGHQVSLEFMMEHIHSASGEGSLSGAASGVMQRLGWWRNINKQVFSSPWNFIFGLGYGIPLTDFHSSLGVTVREPHNSYMSVWGRGGFSALAMWVLAQIALFYNLIKSTMRARKYALPRVEMILKLLICFFIIVLTLALGEDALEKPFWAIPYYFFFGVTLSYSRYLMPHRLPTAETTV